MSTEAVIATARFGLGAHPGELAEAARDAKGWAMAQLGRSAVLDATDLPSSADAVTRTLLARKEKDKTGKDELREVFIAEVGARITAAIDTKAPLLERLVQFWSNHFTVSALRPVVRGFVGAFEREAIRPNVTGRFTDLLAAVTRHPAMLFYLDNVASVGPDSRFGRRSGKGLNENLARELLELHTLGVEGGYMQHDVEALARIITGWTIARPRDPSPGRFRFVQAVHEPGKKVLLGRDYGPGERAGLAALDDLAHHPATARHLARKFATHFIADTPPPQAVAAIAAVFRKTEGDLAATMRAVIGSPEAWRAPWTKLRTPNELLIAACRATERRPRTEAAVGTLRLLDQPTFLAPSPAGWPDIASAWASPEAILRRIEWCQAFAERVAAPDPIAMAEAAFGDALPAATAAAVRRAPSRRSGLALVLASPEFQRR